MTVQLLDVIYEGWGEQWKLGRLADDGRRILFEYTGTAISQGFALSPRLPVQAEAFHGFGDHQFRLPGAIADALPDGWGLLVMDRLFRRHGRDPRRMSPLDRLAFIADRAMGALSFQPSDSLALADEALTLQEMATQIQYLVHDKEAPALATLAKLGGSPQGARPKALIHFAPSQAEVSTAPFGSAEPWLVKFQAADEHPEVCAIEMLYARLAHRCGIEMPDTHLFDISPKLAAFGIKRFDRHDGMRVPILTAAGAFDLNFRQPQIDYAGLLRITRAVTRNQAEVDKAFRRAVFNVVFHNRDDHSKNFSYRMDEDRSWRLAPGYDLTFSFGPGGEHHMDVGGEARNITRSQLLRLAHDHDVAGSTATAAIDLTCATAEHFATLAADYPIRRATRQQINTLIGANLRRMIG